MYKDPVVEELRENARNLFEECGNDLHEIVKRLREEQSRGPQRVIRRRKDQRPSGDSSSAKETPGPRA